MRRLARLLAALVVIALIGLGAAALWTYGRPAETSSALTGSGTIEAATITVGAEQPGRVEEVLVEDGNRVLAGDVLVRLDASRLDPQRDQAEAGVEAAEAGVDAAEAMLRASETSLELVPDGAAQEQIDAAEAQTEAARAQVDAAEAQADAARAALAVVESQIAAATTSSPVDGVVLTRAIEPGEYAAPGTPLIVLGQLDSLTITVYVPEDRYGAIRLGQTARVNVDSFPGETFAASVVRIADEAEFTPRNVQTAESRASTVFAIHLAIDNPDGRLKPGMPADVVF